jgi:hypothetical protein
MAKAKKIESTTASGTNAEMTTVSKKKPAKSKPVLPISAPMIDTGLAAESAAKRVAAGFAPSAAAGIGNMPARESAAFKNLKQSMSKPASAGLANLLDQTAGPAPKKPNLPFHGGKQVGRNQTFGADVNRSGVPRRTGGG